MSRNIVVIDGHPDPAAERFCHALAAAYENGARQAGNEVRRISVAALDFPVLRTQAEFLTGAIPPDIAAAQEAIGWAGHIVIVYPLWHGTMPALLKAFLEQVLRPGFAFEESGEGWPKPGLGGRTARIVVTMGMPALVYRLYYLSHSLRSLERNILRLCGIRPVGETVLGMIEQAGAEKRAKWLARLESHGRRGR